MAEHHEKAPRVYTEIRVCPVQADEDGVGAMRRHLLSECEIWGSYTEVHSKMGEFDSDGIIGHLYALPGSWVLLNQAGYPSQVFMTRENLVEWLGTLSPRVVWETVPRQ